MVCAEINERWKNSLSASCECKQHPKCRMWSIQKPRIHTVHGIPSLTTLNMPIQYECTLSRRGEQQYLYLLALWAHISQHILHGLFLSMLCSAHYCIVTSGLAHNCVWWYSFPTIVFLCSIILCPAPPPVHQSIADPLQAVAVHFHPSFLTSSTELHPSNPIVSSDELASSC